MHYAQEVINLQGLCVLIVGYLDMSTYPLTKYCYIIKRIYFIYRLFILFISTFSFLLLFYAVSWRYKRDYLHSSMDISFYIMFYIINMMKLNIKQLIDNTKKVPIRTWPSQSTICSYTLGINTNYK